MSLIPAEPGPLRLAVFSPSFISIFETDFTQLQSHNLFTCDGQDNTLPYKEAHILNRDSAYMLPYMARDLADVTKVKDLELGKAFRIIQVAQWDHKGPSDRRPFPGC